MKLFYIGPLTIVGWVNTLILQWFGIRLQAWVGMDDMIIKEFSVIGFILPLTGWKYTPWAPDYIWVWKVWE